MNDGNAEMQAYIYTSFWDGLDSLAGSGQDMASETHTRSGGKGCLYGALYI